MSNYRRLISYIYEYEGKTKGRNVGFAKLEARSGQCKLSVNVKRIFTNGDAGVYLLSPTGEILLGKLFLRGGNGEFRTTVQVENVEGSSCGMDGCYGLSIHDPNDDWRTYRTIWEDEITCAAEIELSKAAPEEKTEVMETAEKAVAEMEEELAREEGADRTLSADTPDLPKAQTISTGMGEWKGIGVSKEEEQQPYIPQAGDQKELEQLDLTEEPEEAPEQIWDRLEKMYPKIPAFDSEHGCVILSIKPQDIGLLPREVWVYGNNSFLLHGYYNYRYLILARLENPRGNPRYLLGIPGHYYSNEKYMADMFGFPHFVLSKKQPSGDGRFGYWYTDIRFSASH